MDNEHQSEAVPPSTALTAPAETTVEELVDNDSVPTVYVPGEDDDSKQRVITPELRKEIIGRLAEFEMRMMDLKTEQQQNFVLEILRDPTSWTKAAVRAGYADGPGIKQQAHALRINAKIQAAIAAGQLLREDRTMVTADRTINELALIAFSDITHFTVEPGTNEVKAKPGVPEYFTRAVQSAEFKTTVSESGDKVVTTYNVKIKMWSKTDALRMLALYQKLISPDGGTNVQVNNEVHNHTHNVWQVGDKKIQF